MPNILPAALTAEKRSFLPELRFSFLPLLLGCLSEVSCRDTLRLFFLLPLALLCNELADADAEAAKPIAPRPERDGVRRVSDGERFFDFEREFEFGERRWGYIVVDALRRSLRSLLSRERDKVLR